MLSCCRRGQRSLGSSNLQAATVASGPSLTGQWEFDTDRRAGNNVQVKETFGGKVEGTWVTNGRRAFHGQRSGNTLTMDFPDYGTIIADIKAEGNLLIWSNGTQWTRVGPLTGQWQFEGAKREGNDVIVQDSSDGKVEGRWVTNGRPAFRGQRSGDTLTMDFPDYKGTIIAKILEDGNFLKWSNDSQWKRIGPSLTGQWEFDIERRAGNNVELLESIEGKVEGRWLTNGRVAFSGERSGRTLKMSFTDYNEGKPITAKVNAEGNHLEWDNKTQWTRIGK